MMPSIWAHGSATGSPRSRARSLEDGGHHGAVSGQALMRAGTEEPEVARQQQMVLDLAGRAHRVVQEACEVVVDVPTATLGEVGWDGDARATGLDLQAQPLVGKDLCRCSIDGEEQGIRPGDRPGWPTVRAVHQ